MSTVLVLRRKRIRGRNLTSYLVTTPDGRLDGLVRRDEIE
jgi:hypothetical protein